MDDSIILLIEAADFRARRPRLAVARVFQKFQKNRAAPRVSAKINSISAARLSSASLSLRISEKMREFWRISSDFQKEKVLSQYHKYFICCTP